MEIRCDRYILVSALISLTFQGHFLHIMASEVHHILYQTFVLDTGTGDTVECYGTCDNSTHTPIAMNVSRCDGPKIRLDCIDGEQVKIHEAMIGKLTRNLNICKEPFDCRTDITTKVQTLCNGVQVCLIDVTNGPIRNKCGIVKFLAMDVLYACEPKPTTIIPVIITTTTATTTKAATTKRTTGSETKTKKTTTKMQSTITMTKKVRLPTSTIMPSPITPTSSTTEGTATSSSAVRVATVALKDNDSFWLMAAYNTIYDSEFLKQHKGHLALVFLLSTFVGLVIFMCIYLDYCRRAKKKKDMHDRHCDEERQLKTVLVQQPNKRMSSDIINLKESLSNHTFVACKYAGNCNNTNSDDEEEDEEEEEDGGGDEEEEEGDVYVNASVATPFLKRELERKLYIHSPIDPNQGITSSTLSSMSLNDTADSILPPPHGFAGDENCTKCTAATHVHPHTSLASNTTLAPLAYLEQDLRNKREHTQYDRAQLVRHITFDEYTRNLAINHPSEAKHLSSDEVTSQHGRFIREATRTCKCKLAERPRSNSVQGEGKRALNNKCTSKQHPKRGRIHVMQKCDEVAPLRTCNQKSICSDNETSRRRRRCQAEYKRGCSCREQGTSLSDLECKRCRKADASSNFNCCSSLTSNGRSSHEEDFEDNGGACALLSVSNERFKNEEFRVEESGYQTRDDTGTDSLCSSSFSTDQEDSRMFLPASLNNSTHACKSKNCHLRNESAKRDQKLLVVRDLNKQKLPRRLRRDGYTDTDVHQHNSSQHTSVDVHSYDSSLDDTSSKESEKKCQTNHKKGKHDGGLHPETRCNCVYVIVPPDAITTVDEVHL